MSYGTNKKLESLFNLPEVKEKFSESREVDETVDEQTTDIAILTAVDKIDAALPAVRNLDASDLEMDDLAETAMASYKDLMELGMQVDSRAAAEIFSVASGLLGHAITAKTAKLNKKLKIIDLQLRKAKLDADSAKGNKPADDDGDVEGTAQLVSRNELLESLRKHIDNKPK